MKRARIFFTLSSTLIVAASVYGGSAEARTYNQCIEGNLSKAECACEFALQKGTTKALREYLKLYRSADTACNASGSTSNLTEIKSDDDVGSTTPEGGSDPSSAHNNKGFGNGNEGGCQGGGCGDSDNPGKKK